MIERILGLVLFGALAVGMVLFGVLFRPSVTQIIIAIVVYVLALFVFIMNIYD